MRTFIGVLAIVACLFLMQAAGRIGFSRLLARYALIANSVPAADQAIRLSPSDPDAHRARAAVLTRQQQPAEAVRSLESAASLRYRDDLVWLELGNAREEIGDTVGALEAFDQAVRWAPAYAHTHWQRGNLLLRTGKSAEAFADFRIAAAANPGYLPGLIDLAWGLSGEDVNATEQLVGIKDRAERLALIRFLAKRGKGKETKAQIQRLPAPLSKENKDEVVRLLFSAKAFNDAFEIWTPSLYLRVPALFNNGFEDPQILNKPGFGGWFRSHEESKSRLAIDVTEKFAGKSSLQVTLDGEWNSGTALLSQTVLVGLSTTYRVSFHVKTKDLVTGGPPMITVTDAVSGALLGESENFPSTNSWLRLSFEFTTLATTEAAVIRLQRKHCDSSPCPIFGVFWLDEIAIESK